MNYLFVYIFSDFFFIFTKLCETTNLLIVCFLPAFKVLKCLTLYNIKGQIMNHLIHGVLIRTINVSMLFQPYRSQERKPFYLSHFLWNKVLGSVSERRLSENSEYVNPEIRKTLGFSFQNGRFDKPEKAR